MKEKKVKPTAKTPPNKGGKPTLYKEEYCDALRKHMRNGFSFKTFCVTIGVGLQTTKDWVKAHPEFKEAKDDAFVNREFMLEGEIIEVATGKKRGNAQLLKFMAVNILGWKNVKDDEDDKKNNKIEIKLAVDPTKPKDGDKK